MIPGFATHRAPRQIARCAALFCTLALSAGCASLPDDGSGALLKPAGWRNVSTSLAGNDFDDYVADVRQRLAEHRIAINRDKAAQEIDRAAPAQFNPAPHCQNDSQGIVILVHGLSDTAFSMRDLARYFAKRCYVARSVLLPGHGTRSGDMLIVDHDDWIDTVRHLVAQAAQEHERIVLAGFSLGAVVTTTVALDTDSPVDALVAISPAYRISAWRGARLTPYFQRLYPWLDKGLGEDPLRYEAMPTKGVASLVRAIKQMHRRFAQAGRFDRPWLLAHSLDDNTTLPLDNRAFVLAQGPRARVLEFYSDQDVSRDIERVRQTPGTSDAHGVKGLSHLAVHVSPDNPHYGVDGSYRHCGSLDGRNRIYAELCENADEVEYADWDKTRSARKIPTAVSSFNPNFDQLESELDTLLTELIQ